jgi:hypothetical protein
MAMIPSIKVLAGVSILFSFLAGFGTGSSRAQSFTKLELDGGRVSWSKLSFSAESFAVSVTVEMQLKALPAAKVEAALINSPRGIAIRPSTPDAWHSVVNMTIDPIFRSPVKLLNEVWFNPEDAAALGWVRLDRGEDDQKKIYRFTREGVFRHRIEPGNPQEAEQGPEQWTDVKDTFYPYDLARLGCPSVSENLALIYIISAAVNSLSRQPLAVCVFGKRQLHNVRLRSGEIQTLKIDFIEKKAQGVVHRKGKLEALKIMVEATPMVMDQEEVEEFSFLGFHKDIAIFIDPVSGLPIQASGFLPTVGQVDLKLSEARLKN